METNYLVQSTSGERKVTIISIPCNGDPSYVTYQLFNDGVRMGGGVVKPNEVRSQVVKWAKRMLIGVTSVTLTK